MRLRTPTESEQRGGWLGKVLLGLAGALTAVVLLANAMLHLEATSLEARNADRERDVLAQLEFLDRANEAGAPLDMQHIYPEGFFSRTS